MAIIWREYQRDIKSFKKIIIYLLILIFYIYNCKSAAKINEAIIDVMIGFLIVSMYSSLNSYSNIAVILSLPISIKNYNLYKTIYFLIKMTGAIVTTVICLKLKSGMEINLLKLYFILTAMCSIVCVNYLAHYLLAICKKKFSYFIFLVMMVVISGFRLFMLEAFTIIRGLYLVIACFTIYLVIEAFYKKINTERILKNWI